MGQNYPNPDVRVMSVKHRPVCGEVKFAVPDFKNFCHCLLAAMMPKERKYLNE